MFLRAAQDIKNHAISSLSWAADMASRVRKAISNYMLGDYKHNRLISRARSSSSHAAVMRVGPPKVGFNVAYVLGRGNNQMAQQQLDIIMKVPGENARNIYAILSMITGASLLLADNSVNALKSHKQFARYLQPNALLGECKQIMPLLLKKMQGEISIENDLYLTIRDCVIQMFSTVLLGVEVSPSLIEVILTIDNTLQTENLVLPLSLQTFLPATQQRQAKINNECRKFLRENWYEILDQIAEGKSNLLTDAIREIRPHGLDLDDITVIGINKIADHPLVRNAIFSLFAAENAAHTIANTVFDTLALLEHPRVNALRAALDQQQEINANFLTESHRTTLQAIYHCGLINHNKFVLIHRYTSESIHNEEAGLWLPPRTHIFYMLDSLQQELKASMPSDIFEKMCLSDKANSMFSNLKLGEGMFTLFGRGARACPATAVVGIIAKHYILSMIKAFASCKSGKLVARAQSGEESIDPQVQANSSIASDFQPQFRRF